MYPYPCMILSNVLLAMVPPTPRKNKKHIRATAATAMLPPCRRYNSELPTIELTPSTIPPIWTSCIPLIVGGSGVVAAVVAAIVAVVAAT